MGRLVPLVLLALLLCSMPAHAQRADLVDQVQVRFVNLFSSTMSLAFFVGDSQEQVVGDVAPRTASDYLLVGKGNFTVAVVDSSTSDIVLTFGNVSIAEASYTFVGSLYGPLQLTDWVGPVNVTLIDTAYLRVAAVGLSDPALLLNASSMCYRCQKFPLLQLQPGQVSQYVAMDATWPTSLDVLLGDSSIVHQDLDLGQYGTYTLLVVNTSLLPSYKAKHARQQQSEANITLVLLLTDLPPGLTYLPIWVAIGVLVAMAVTWPLMVLVWRRVAVPESAPLHFMTTMFDDPRRPTRNVAALEVSGEQRPAAEAEPKKLSNRITSLDCMRGLSLTIMIFVNYGGGGYWFFNHSVWNGLTFADLVFPWFIMIMGAAIPIAFSSSRRPTSALFTFYKIVRRSAILFALGIIVNHAYVLQNLRVPGVLQRFSVSYFFVACLVAFCPKLGPLRVNMADVASASTNDRAPLLGGAGGAEDPETAGGLSPEASKPGLLKDLTPFVLEWLLGALLPASAWVLISFLLPVPNCPTGYLGPGGLEDNAQHFNCTGGAAGYIDKLVLGVSHIYGHPTAQPVYRCGAYDPEGLLGCLTSIVLCFLGAHLGRIALSYRGVVARVGRWVVWGVLLTLGGLALAKFSVNDGWIPINKNLWSLSFVLVMGGTGYILFAIMFLLVDHFRIWNGSPFVYPGRNSITVYMGSEVLATYFPFGWSGSGSHAQLLTMCVVSTGLWLALAYYMAVCDFYVNI